MILSIIIPTLNAKELLQKNLPYVFSTINDLNKTEIIIVDNNSYDGTEKLVRELKNINYLKLEKNYGFTGAVNFGVKQAKGEYLLVLNNDCLLKKDTIEKMVDFLEKNKEYVATQPIVYKSNTDEIENIGFMIDFWKGKTNPVRDRNFQFSIFNFQRKEDLFKKRYLFGLSATCLLIKRDVFIKIGMFDERFHSYLEDVDLFIRLAKAGYNYYPTLNAYCYHHHMATSSKMGNYKERHDLLNWIRIIIKNYPSFFILKHFSTLFIERLRNINGFIKKTVKIKL